MRIGPVKPGDSEADVRALALRRSLRSPIHIINPVDKTKLSSEKSCLISVPFLTFAATGQQSFSRLLNSDWSIHISGPPVVYKETGILQTETACL